MKIPHCTFRALRVVSLLLVLGFGSTATAQDSPELPTPPAADPVAEAPIEAPVADPPVEEDPRMAEAVTRFRQGLMLARAGNCVGALAELDASLAIVERPNTLYNIARCQEELFRYDLAVAAYERYMSIAPLDAPDRASVTATMTQLRALLGTIVVQSNVPAEVWIGERHVGDAPGEILVPGGRHAVEVRADGYLPLRREVQVASRARAELSVTLESADVHITNQDITNQDITNVNVTEEGGAPPAVFITAAVLTALSLGTAAALSFRVLGTRKDGDGLPERDLIAREQQNQQISDHAVLADVFWGITGGLAVTTIILVFVTDWGDEEEREEGTTITPSASANHIGLSVQGSF